jgi:hypothetical protein
MSNTVPTNFAQLGDAISPTYLNGPVFQAYRLASSVLYDDAVDLTAIAIRAAISSLAPSDALTWIAQDRQIFQGPSETTAGYIARLQQWLDLWRLAGNSTSVLLAYLSWLTPLAPQVQVVQSSRGTSPITTWQTYVAGATPFPAGTTIPTPPNLLTVSPGNWDWDGSSEPYYYPWMSWRVWIIIQSNGAQAPWPAPTKTWGSGGTLDVIVVPDAIYGTKYVNAGTPASASSTSFAWGDGTCWGWAGTAQQALQLTQLAATWKSAGTWVPWIIVCYDATWFQPTNSDVGGKLPNGTWGYCWVIVPDATYGTKYAPSRPSCTTCTMIVGTEDGQDGEPLGD